MDELEYAKKNGLTPELREKLLQTLSEEDRRAFETKDVGAMTASIFHTLRTEQALERRKTIQLLLARDCGFPGSEKVPLPTGG